MFKIKVAVSFPKPSYNYSCLNLIPQSNISRIISMFAWVALKKATFCGNNCENVGIILRIIGEFKKNFRKEQLENLKA